MLTISRTRHVACDQGRRRQARQSRGVHTLSRRAGRSARYAQTRWNRSSSYTKTFVRPEHLTRRISSNRGLQRQARRSRRVHAPSCRAGRSARHAQTRYTRSSIRRAQPSTLHCVERRIRIASHCPSLRDRRHTYLNEVPVVYSMCDVLWLLILVRVHLRRPRTSSLPSHPVGSLTRARVRLALLDSLTHCVGHRVREVNSRLLKQTEPPRVL
ncbi:hypothetical protein EXIGLDRAFT_436591 [Exidia glandulosa HHB12029]|uniref:Uncharacterized protein n=1 Tax=Exidia glandulosa HHB12029 TaxID=1314781 RepID=A0A165B8J7_EXIGL|nr:hypothetical protein EXIGLDRAFT_436591 [Exidia glandulosa HHB12029]